LSKKYLILFISIILSAYFISCSDELTTVGFETLGDDLINIVQFDSQLDSVNQTSASVKRELPLGASGILMLGKYGNAESSILIRYLFFDPDTAKLNLLKREMLANNVTILDADISFVKRYVYGDSLANLDFTVHRILSQWASDFSGDSLPSLSFDQTDVAVNKNITDSLLSFDINHQWVMDWFKSEADTNVPIERGLLIKPTDNSGKVMGFRSLNQAAEDLPTINVIYQIAGSDADTIEFISTVDLSAVTGTNPWAQTENIAIQAGVVINSNIWFDISSIPQTAIINNAELILTLDTIQTTLGTPSLNSVAVFPLTDSSSLTLDSTIAASLSRIGDKLTGNVTRLIQKMVSTNINQGFFFRGTSQQDGLESFILRGSSSTFAERPRLKITYTNKQ
jgi:hypothetical protein